MNNFQSYYCILWEIKLQLLTLELSSCGIQTQKYRMDLIYISKGFCNFISHLNVFLLLFWETSSKLMVGIQRKVKLPRTCYFLKSFLFFWLYKSPNLDFEGMMPYLIHRQSLVHGKVSSRNSLVKCMFLLLKNYWHFSLFLGQLLSKTWIK